MDYRLLADLVSFIHLSFVLFAVGGGFLVVRWRRCAYAHIPAAAWAALVEFMSWPCPLTPLENWLRRGAGPEAYTGGFVEHYILPVLYPSELTRTVEIALGVFVLMVNVVLYLWIWLRSARN